MQTYSKQHNDEIMSEYEAYKMGRTEKSVKEITVDNIKT